MTATGGSALRRLAMLGGVGLALTVILAALDPLLEGEPFTARGFLADAFDRGLLVAAMMASALAVGRITRVEAEQATIRSDLHRARAEGEAWRSRARQLLDGLSGAIEAQFAAWGLTRAEADIAGLLLKGASLRDIAAVRRTSEATIRQQAQAVYRKSGLANRAELAAFFLEGLFEVVETQGGDPAGSLPVDLARSGRAERRSPN